MRIPSSSAIKKVALWAKRKPVASQLANPHVPELDEAGMIRGAVGLEAELRGRSGTGALLSGSSGNQQHGHDHPKTQRGARRTGGRGSVHSREVYLQRRRKVDRIDYAHQTSLEAEPREEVYLPVAQRVTMGGELVIRTSGNPYAVLPAVNAAVLAVWPDVPLRNVRTMEELMATRVAQRRLNMLLLGLFGLLGLVIAAVGIYGVLSCVVAQRTREIGVRMALGATRGRVVGMVMMNAALLVAVGLAIGTAAAWYLRAAAESFLFRVEAGDPRAFAGALITLSLAALVASALPARRAASVDPVVALRAE